ncbi:phage tail tape measure protein [Globicatella sanguinis]
MALRKAGIELDLRNEAAYKAGLKEIAYSTRALAAETKIAAARLGVNATATQKYKTNFASLNKEIRNSQLVTQSYGRALDRLPESQKKIKEQLDQTTAAWKDSREQARKLQEEYYRIGNSSLGWTSEQALEAKHAYQEQLEQTRLLSDETERLTQLHNNNAERLRELPVLLRESELATEELKMQQIQLHNEWRNQGGIFADAANKLGAIGDTAINVGTHLTEAGETMTRLFTVPIATGFGFAAKEAMAFQSQIKQMGPLMSNGQALTSGMRAELMNLGDESRRMAIAYGKSTTEINEGMAELVRTGFKTKDVLSILPHVLDASIASGENFNEVMSTGVEGLMQFGLNAGDVSKNMQRVTDSYTTVANATKSGINDIGMAMSYVGSTAYGLGITLEETASMIGILTNRGLESSMAGTGLRAVLASLANPSKEATKGISELGINVEEFKKGTIGIPEIIEQITANTKDLTDEQRTALLIQAFGRVGANAMNALYAEGADNIRALTKETEAATGVTKEMAEAMKDTPQFRFDQSIAKLKDLGIEIGENLLPIIDQWIAKGGELMDSFSKMDEGTQNVIVRFGLLTAAAGPILMFFGGIIRAAGNVMTMFSGLVRWLGKLLTPMMGLVQQTGLASAAFNALLSPVGLATSALALLAAGYFTLTEDSRKAKQAIEDFPNIDGVTAEQAESIKRTSDEYSNLTLSLETLAGQTVEYKDTVVEAIGGIIAEIERLNNYDDPSLNNMFESLPPQVAAFGQALIEEDKKTGVARIERAKEVQNSIGAIIETAASENREVSDRERAYIRSATDELAMIQAESLARNSEQGKQIYSALTADLATMTNDQLITHGQNVNAAFNRLNDDFSKNKQAILDNQSKLGVEGTKLLLQELEVATQGTKDKLIQEWSNAFAEIYRQNGANAEGVINGVIDSIEKSTGMTLEALGYQREDIANFIAQGASRIDESLNAMFVGLDRMPAKFQGAGNRMEFALGGILDKMGITFEEMRNNAEINLTEVGQQLMDAGVSWEDLQTLLQAGAQGEISVEDYEFLKKLAAANAQWKEDWEKKQVEIEVNEEGLRDVETLINDWNNLTLEEKRAEVEARGQEGIGALIDSIGTYDGLQPEFRKQVIAEAKGKEALENILVLTGEWYSLDLPTKRAILEAQIDSGPIKNAIESMDLWNNAEFVRQFAEIDTNAPDASLKITQLINEFRIAAGLPPLQIAMNAEDEATGKLESLNQKVTAMNGREVNTTLTATDNMSGGVGAAKAQIDSIPESKTTSLGTTIMNAIGGLLGALSLSAYKAQIDAIPESKNTAISISADGITERTNEINDYNKSVGSMKSKSTTANTSTPNMIGNTNNVNKWNTAVTNSKSKSTTASTYAPNIVTNTNRVWNWISALGSTYSKTSTLTTYVDKVYRTFGKHADGGHIDMYANGGNIQWGGMFANGGNVPKGYAGIVGEAGPELFQVTKSGVKITPLSTGEKMRGIKGVLEDLKGDGNQTSNQVVVNISIDSPVLREEYDIQNLADTISKTLERDMRLNKIFKKGKLA